MTTIFDRESNILVPGDCVVHDDGRSGKLIYNPRNDVHHVVFDDKSVLPAHNMDQLPVVKVELAWTVPQVPADYFGLRISVPNTVKYIAIDSLGNVYGFLIQPKCGDESWSSEFPSYYLGEMRMHNLHWTKSLIKVRG